ncbi:CDP-alcohol phosphatidyltransferase family protein [Henriciella litoralis]|uniref:CDP-alcohol phosphatidyltransferase family protein n=1 Tax=Henriciella litoralis TaxID=568102 RepID=UPI000A01DC0F|nr:CDP-alcohol phosphatidyltransferase family protein [Henriciella litoralis]
MISNIVTLFRTGLTVPLFVMLMLSGPGIWPLGLFLLAGLLDILDGKLARALNQTSRLGGLMDLVGDRLLTLSAVAGLLASQSLSALGASAAIILVARCAIVASAGEALGGPDRLAASKLEHLKIASSFAGLSLAMAPQFLADLPVDQAMIAYVFLLLAAALCLLTLADYTRQTVNSLQTA